MKNKKRSHRKYWNHQTDWKLANSINETNITQINASVRFRLFVCAFIASVWIICPSANALHPKHKTTIIIWELIAKVNWLTKGKYNAEENHLDPAPWGVDLLSDFDQLRVPPYIRFGMSQIFELLAIGSLCYAQRFLGPPRSKCCKLMEENLWRRVVSETILAMLWVQ